MTRRASIQQIADAFVRAGYETTFVSVRFSPLSLMKGDPRSFLWQRGNQLEEHNGLNCYLWRTPFHPFSTGHAASDQLTAPLHSLYEQWPNADLDRILAAASVVVFESGLGIMLIRRARRLNPSATVIYYSADALDVIGAHSHLRRALERSAPAIDHCSLLAQRMAPEFRWAGESVFHLPAGIHPPDFADTGANPYQAPVNAVSVGSMLFDADFFKHAAAAFPSVQFHVIGSRSNLRIGGNVHIYPEMPFSRMLPFVAHATIGLAPYKAGQDAAYLCESSLKLTHYDYLGLPAVCPHFAVGDHPQRYGYTPGQSDEIAEAIQRALSARDRPFAPRARAWDDLLPRLVRPRDFPDTKIPAAMFA